MSDSFEIATRFAKVDENNVVWGWAIICTVDGIPYKDTQQDYISEAEMCKAATNFMAKSREGKVMHAGPVTGRIVGSISLTADLAKSLFGIVPKQTGWIIGYEPTGPSAPEVLAKFRSGELSGFSIGGKGRRVARTSHPAGVIA